MGKKEERIKKIRKLTKTIENIRNMGIVAHIDHGKCVSGDTRIACGNGEVLQAKELFDRIASEGKKAEEERGEVYAPSSEFTVSSYNKKSGKVESKKISKTWKLRKTENLLEVENELGQVLKTTPEHRFLTMDKDGKFSYIRADKLSEGDTILSARKLTHKSIKDLKSYLLEKLSDDYGFYVNINKSLNRKIEEVPREDLFRMSKTRLKKSSLKHAVWRGQYRLRDIVNICKSMDISLRELYLGISKINYRGHNNRGVHSSLDVELPQEFSPLFYLAGLFLGDGDLNCNITNNSSEIKDRIKREARNLGLDVHTREFPKRGDRIEVGGITLQKMLNTLFDYPLESKSENIQISELVFRSNKNLVKKFIRGYMDADGTVEKSRSAVSVSSKSLKMLEGLQFLLFRFDIASKINRNNNTLYISGKDSLKNFDQIGFTQRVKSKKFKSLLEKSQSAKVDHVPVRGQVLKTLRKQIGLPQSSFFTGYQQYEDGYAGLTKSTLKRVVDIYDELDKGKELPEIKKLRRLAVADTTFTKVKTIDVVEEEEYVYDFTVPENHNFIAEGMVVHNTTLSDNLLYHAGMISKEMTGKQLALDFREDEKLRGITINAANISMVHDFEGDKYLINLIDTPGHVDFGGDVTRAMRAVDGAIVLVCAVEGVMPQTKTVISQALEERVKPILFINKVDRLINELKLNPEELQERFLKIITEANKIIKQRQPEGVDWEVSVEDGSVAFGSAYYNWAISVPYMKKSGITFNEIIEACNEEKQDELADKAPAYEIVLNMSIKHLPHPKEAQKFRIPKIWKGDLESEVGKAMVNCDPEGPLGGMITNIQVFDKREGEVATARLFSGTIKEGQDVYLSGSKSTERVQQVSFYSGASRIKTDEISGGNIIGVTGLKHAFAGETLSTSEMEQFERIKYVSEPVVTMAIEAKSTKDLPRVIEVLRQVAKEDPSLKVEIDQETGEHLLSGMGELHLEVITNRIKEGGLDIEVSEPIVVYRESVLENHDAIEGKSPNKHNKFYLAVEPLQEEVYQAIMEGKLEEGRRKKRSKDIREELVELGMENKEAKRVVDIYRGNVMLDMTRGIVQLEEVIELVLDAFEQVMDGGPLANEPCTKVKVKLTDAKLHEDAIHRGPAQVYPAVRNPIYAGMLLAKPRLLEPIQKIWIDVPQVYISSVTQEVQRRRGQVDKMEQKENLMTLKGKMPIAESFGFAGDIRSASEGHALWSTENAGFEPVPEDLQRETIEGIRKRKGLSTKIPQPQDFVK